MRFTLRDWDRVWFLAFAVDAKLLPGIPVEGAAAAHFLLSRLLRDSRNFGTVRNLLATVYPRGPRPVPADYAGLLAELGRRLEHAELVLVQGPPYNLRTGNPGKEGKAAAAQEAWDFVPAPEPSEDSAPPVKPDDAVPALRFAMQSEDPFPFRFSHGSEKPPGLSLAHALEGGPPALGLSHGSDAGPSLAFAHATEGFSHGLGHSSAIHPSP